MARSPEPPTMASGVINRTRKGIPEVLIARVASAPYEGRWTFPNGPADTGEPAEAALRRALRSLLGMTVKILHAQPPFDQRWDDVVCRWRFFFCDGTGCEVKNQHFAEVRWVPRGALREYDFDPVSQRIVDWLLEEPGPSF